MLRTALAAVLFTSCLFVTACGGQTASAPRSPADGGVPNEDASSPDEDASSPDGALQVDARGADASGSRDASFVDAGPDCGQPPEPTYDCATAPDASPPDGGVCTAYGVDAGAGGPRYPLNCTVTLTTCDTSFGGAQTCNCQAFPGSGPAPTWVCPL